jgi:hypothetical protein
MREKMLQELSRRLVDEGKLIEAGWVSLQIAAIPADAPLVQLDEMRNAFFAGAQHLFASIMSILEPGDEPTDNDLKRLSLINTELEKFLEDFKKRKGIA